MTRARLLVMTLAVLISAVACREEEQDRPLDLDKGTYEGAPMPSLDEETREDLRDRARHQSF